MILHDVIKQKTVIRAIATMTTRKHMLLSTLQLFCFSSSQQRW